MNYAILLSGGTGTRTGSEIPKQYVRRNGHMMITEALGVLLQSSYRDKVVIAADEAWKDEILKDARAAQLPTDRIIGFAMPGDTRQPVPISHRILSQPAMMHLRDMTV